MSVRWRSYTPFGNLDMIVVKDGITIEIDTEERRITVYDPMDDLERSEGETPEAYAVRKVFWKAVFTQKKMIDLDMWSIVRKAYLEARLLAIPKQFKVNTPYGEFHMVTIER